MNLPISLHRNSVCCALSRNSRLEFPSVDILKESYPTRQIGEIPGILLIDSALSTADQNALPIHKAILYRQFLDVASSDHRLDFSLSLHCYLYGGSDWHNFSVLQTYSGSLVESLIVSVSNIANTISILSLLFLLQVTGLTHDFSGEWDGLMCSAVSTVPEIFRWAFWAGRNPQCVSGPSPDSLDRMYSEHYMLYHLRMAGVSQRHSLDVNVYLLVLSMLFGLQFTLFKMARDYSGVQSLKVQMSTSSEEPAGITNCNILFVSDVDDFASFFSPVLNRRTHLIHDLDRMVRNLDVVEILSKCSSWEFLDEVPKQKVRCGKKKRKTTMSAEVGIDGPAAKRRGIKKTRAIKFIQDCLLNSVRSYYELENVNDGKDTLKFTLSVPQLADSESKTTSLGELGCSSEDHVTLSNSRTEADMLAIWDDLVILIQE